ncbi:HNH endonuclease [Nostoc sp. UIC 10607]|jgi:5-methylcytosine-specific restriction endonuclease McrA|uniref:HNH endonuclease n=1 Tax=unclassified Nostoc TaxID=2593658 RepID=UPI0016838270|nr:HNH endonuclease [Nostoc sp. FACHB-133]MBD2527849.1 HNH endonuclease [Nostoc sp. FACHB-133]
MPRKSQQRYPENWSDIALEVKQSVGWRCSKCGLQCIRPDDDTSELTRSLRMALTLTVHHKNFMPEDNRRENLYALCSGCHLSFHTRRRGNVSPGQLSLF